MDDLVARRAVVRGRVQGVFYRASTRDRARELGVVGWVHNDVDGTVRLHVEGRPEAVQQLLDWAGRGPRHAVVVGIDVEEVRPAALESFEVR